MRLRIIIIAIYTLMISNGASAQLLISELLYQPKKGEAEYVELYNNVDTVVNLANYQIVRWVGDSLGKRYSLPAHTINPREYVVLTKDATSVSSNYNVRYLSHLIEVSLPTYPNDGGKVIIAKINGEIIDLFSYNPSMHSKLLKDKAGVALERKNFNVATNIESNWFSAASMSGYGTPTYENSQSKEYLAEENSFIFSNTIISPDGDDYQDELEITYQLNDANLMIKAEVFDAQGMIVKRIVNNELAGTSGTIQWDGKVGGRPFTGQYIIMITLYNLEGKQQVIKRVINVITR